MTAGIVLERVELPCSLCGPPTGVLLLGPLDLDPLGGVGHRQAAEFIGLSTDQGGFADRSHTW